jgi:hypothetical protein
VTPPDAIRDGQGLIRDWHTQEELPSYEGYCCIVAHGNPYICNTYLVNGERQWQIIHYGAYLDTKQIDAFIKYNQAVE